MDKVIRWLIFGATVSLLPLVFVYFELVVRSEAITLSKLIGNGELLVIVWVLSASAFGELFGSKEANVYGKLIFGGVTFVIILASALFFSSIAEAKANNVTLDEHFVIDVSIALFLISLIPSCLCLYFVED